MSSSSKRLPSPPVAALGRQTLQARARRGGVFFEMTLCCGLLILVLAAVAQTSISFLKQQHSASLRDVAAQEAANLLDQSRAITFVDLNADELNRRLPLQSDIKPFKAATWSVSEEEASNGVVGKRVEVNVRWSARVGDARNTRLTMWRFAPSPTTESDEKSEKETDKDRSDDSADDAGADDVEQAEDAS